MREMSMRGLCAVFPAMDRKIKPCWEHRGLGNNAGVEPGKLV